MKYTLSLVLAVLLHYNASFAQVQFDSVLIEMKNIPTHRHSHSHIQGGHDRNDVHYDWDGYASFFRREISNVLTTMTADTIRVAANSNWDPYQTKQVLTIYPDSLWNSFLVNFSELDVSGYNFIGYSLSIRNAPYKFDGKKSIISVRGSQLQDHSMTYTFHKTSFSSGGPAVQTTKVNQGLFGSFTDSSEVTIQLFGSQPLAVKGSVSQEFSCYPNPATSQITITYPRNIDDIVISNSLGQEILHISTNGMSYSQIDISNLSHGVYWARVGNEIRKFIIAR